jgi:glycerophosphoryl diester phosphodiesterase
VLHDETLDRETAGFGHTAAHTGANLSALRYRTGDCAPILSEDLKAMLAVNKRQRRLIPTFLPWS